MSERKCPYIYLTRISCLSVRRLALYVFENTSYIKERIYVKLQWLGTKCTSMSEVKFFILHSFILNTACNKNFIKITKF